MDHLIEMPTAAEKAGDTADSDETAAGLILRLMQAGIMVRVLAWLPTRFQRDHAGFVPHCEEEFFLADLVREDSTHRPKVLNSRVGLVALDARIGPGNEAGAHHQKFIVIRVQGLDVAYVGGVDLAFTRRDAPAVTSGFNLSQPPQFNEGDWQSAGHMPATSAGWPHDSTTDYSLIGTVHATAHASGTDLPENVYGDALQRWHDQHLRLTGSVVKTLEEHFAERWIRTGRSFQSDRRRDNWAWGDVLFSEWTDPPEAAIPPPPVGPDINVSVGGSTCPGSSPPSITPGRSSRSWREWSTRSNRRPN